MLRIVALLLALAVTAGGIGFYLGRRTAGAAPELQTRNRIKEPIPVATAEPHISLPIAGLTRKDLEDTFNEARGTERKHEAQDILAPRGTPVLAVDNGVVKKLFLSKPGGITLYQFDPSGRYCYYYAHLGGYGPD